MIDNYTKVILTVITVSTSLIALEDTKFISSATGEVTTLLKSQPVVIPTQTFVLRRDSKIIILLANDKVAL